MGATNRVVCSLCHQWVGGDCPHFRTAERALLASTDAILSLPRRHQTDNKWRLGPRFGRVDHPAFLPVRFEKGHHDVSYKIPLPRGRIHITGTDQGDGIAYDVHLDFFDPDRVTVFDGLGHVADVAGGTLGTFRDRVLTANTGREVCPPLVVDPTKAVEWSDTDAPHRRETLAGALAAVFGG